MLLSLDDSFDQLNFSDGNKVIEKTLTKIEQNKINKWKSYSFGNDFIYAKNSSTPRTGIGNAMAHCIQLISFIVQQTINIRCENHQWFFIYNDLSVIWHVACALVKYQTQYSIYNIPSTMYDTSSALCTYIDLTKPYIRHALMFTVQYKIVIIVKTIHKISKDELKHTLKCKYDVRKKSIKYY